MKKLLLFYIAIFLTSIIIAQTGPNNGTTFTTAVIAGSSQSWINTNAVAFSDNNYAYFANLSNTVGAHTDYLVATNFGFSIPVGATIDGIIVEVERSDPSFKTADYSIKIVKGGIVSGTEHASGAGYSGSDNYYLIGNPGDLWGTAWSAADINASDFGVAIAAQRISVNGTTSGRIDHLQITIFYSFVLPITLKNFTASTINKSVRLNWTTTDESDMNHFEIQRSSNGRNFYSIGSMPCTNTSLLKNYAFDDNNPLNATGYYRLAMVSVDGKIKYSKIVSAQLNTGNSVSLYPSLLMRGSNLNINNVSGQRLSISFFTSTGQLVSTINTSQNYIPAQTFSHATGLIFYKAVDEKNIVRATGTLLVQ